MRIQTIILAITSAVIFSSWAENTDLPLRTSPKPQTTSGVPHVQIGIEANPELTVELLQRVEKLPGVEIRETVISLPGAKGFWLGEEMALSRPDAIVGGREFAHVHPDGSLHASLQPELAGEAVEKGWAIPHPWSDKRPGWEGFVMIYTPTSMEELNIVFQLVLGSYNYITGQELSVEKD